MKKILLTAAIFLTAFLFTGETKAEYRHGGYGVFYTALSPHGSWIEIDHGVVVWRPTMIRRSWAPYMDGQWIWTSDGWYWDSYEPFGHITYHYGRWYNDDYYGWIWVPDYEWAPAWVEWRYDDDYIGWAPLPPYATFSISIGLHFTYDYHTPYNHWHFVKYRYFCDPYVTKYYVAPKYKHRIHSNTRYRTDYGYERGRVVNRGVDVDYVRKRTGRDIREREVERVTDLRQVERSSGRNNNDRIRTFVASRDELSREAKDVEIKRSERNSTLQTSRIELGERKTDREEKKTSTRDLERNRNDADSRNGNEIRQRNEEVKRSTEVTKNSDSNNRTRVTDRKQTETRQEVSKPEVRTEQKRNEAPHQKIERREAPKQRVESRTERKVEAPSKESNTPVQRERKVESREQKRTEPQRVERQGSNNERRSERKERGARQR